MKKSSKPSIVFSAVAAVAAVFCAQAGDETIDGKDYWRDDAGTLHQYLYVQGHTSTLWSPKFLNQPGDTETVPYDDSAIWVTSPNLTYSGSWNFSATATYNLYGMCFQKAIAAMDRHCTTWGLTAFAPHSPVLR